MKKREKKKQTETKKKKPKNKQNQTEIVKKENPSPVNRREPYRGSQNRWEQRQWAGAHLDLANTGGAPCTVWPLFGARTWLSVGFFCLDGQSSGRLALDRKYSWPICFLWLKILRNLRVGLPWTESRILRSGGP